MTKKVQEALKRVENELALHGVGSESTQFARFIDDLWLLVTYVKKQRRTKRD